MSGIEIRTPRRRSRLFREGFTLVELSIVLVIIALLVGAIAGLRTYTRNAAVTTMMNQAKLYIDAFNQFQTVYNAPPGDYTGATAAWDQTKAANTSDGVDHDGDGNGLIRASTAVGGKKGELFYTFQHLALAGFIQGTFTGATVGGGGTYDAKIGTNIIGEAKENVGYLFDNPDHTDTVPDGFVTGDAVYFDGQYPNVLILAGHNRSLAAGGTEGGLPDNAFLTATQAQNLDEKYDDGLPGTGSIMTPKGSALAGCATGDTTAATYTAPTTDQQNTPACWILIKIQ